MTSADNTGATGNDSSCGGTGDTIDEWWCYTATGIGFQLTVTTCLPGTQFDTTLAAFDNGGLEVACNDDAIGSPAECSLGGLNRFSTVHPVAVDAGESYLFRVSVFNDDFTGSGGFGTAYEIDFDFQMGGSNTCPAAGSGDELGDTPLILVDGISGGDLGDNTAFDRRRRLLRLWQHHRRVVVLHADVRRSRDHHHVPPGYGVRHHPVRLRSGDPHRDRLQRRHRRRAAGVPAT